MHKDLKNLKQLLRFIKGTIHDKRLGRNPAGCNATRKSTPLLHISRTQLTITPCSAEAELYAMGQATIKAQHIKQVIEEVANCRNPKHQLTRDNVNQQTTNQQQ
eukprot:3643303-Amphidinium_carterae.2